MSEKIRWKKEPKETELRRIGAAARGYVLHDGKTVYSHVSPSGGGWRSIQNGRYWVVPTHESIPYKNTCQTPCETVEDAKAQAKDYVMSHLKKAKAVQS